MELTAAEVWARIQDGVRERIPEHAFRTWVASAKAVAFTADQLLLEARTRFHADVLEDRYLQLCKEEGAKVLGNQLDIGVSAAANAEGFPLTSIGLGDSTHRPPSTAPTTTPSEAPRSSQPHLGHPALNDRYTFDRFVVGTNNQLASAACGAVAEKPARMYNPLFLYGGVGLGKTHLMQAIGHQLLGSDPDRRVAYVSSEQFMNELVTAIRTGSTAAFRARYREMDLLLVDDVQFLRGKESTQEEFFHTFNALYDSQRQIVLTSDRPPKDMEGLEERLVSRFEWGLVVDMRPPDFETRMAILRRKADDEGLVISDDVLEFVAHSCKASVRELEGAVIKLLAYSSLRREDITPDLARTLLSGFIRSQARDYGPVASPQKVLEVVARRWRIGPDAMVSRRRTRDVAVPRQVAMYIMRKRLGMSLPGIGDVFGRDHSTVIHSIRKVEKLMGTDEDFRHQVQETLVALGSPDGPSYD